nr:MAG TPA: hypothetical protein [Caudoviricetes sp.]
MAPSTDDRKPDDKRSYNNSSLIYFLPIPCRLFLAGRGFLFNRNLL